MERHYEILENTKISTSSGYAYRIKATMDLPEHNVKKGDIGGYVSNYYNLNGNAWVADDAMIVDRARAYDNVLIKDNAIVKDSAIIHDNVCIKDNAVIEGHAIIYDNAVIGEYANIKDKVKIEGNPEILGITIIKDNVIVSGNSKIYDKAILSENIRVENAIIYGNAILKYGRFTGDIRENLVNYIACSLNILPINGKYILYKRVFKTETKGIYRSYYDPKFIYKDNEIIEVENYDDDFRNSCSSGIHCSTPFYWKKGDTIIAVEVDVKDIITCKEGKIRAKKVKVLGEVKY